MPWKTDSIATSARRSWSARISLFVTSGEEDGCAMFKLSAAAPEIAWESKGPKSVMMNYWANAVVHDGYPLRHLRRIQRKEDGPQLRRSENRQAEVVEEELRQGRGDPRRRASVDHDQKGGPGPGPANPTKYEEKARVSMLGENRTSPTIADKRLYLRDRENIYCLDIAASR